MRTLTCMSRCACWIFPTLTESPLLGNAWAAHLKIGLFINGCQTYCSWCSRCIFTASWCWSLWLRPRSKMLKNSLIVGWIIPALETCRCQTVDRNGKVSFLLIWSPFSTDTWIEILLLSRTFHTSTTKELRGLRHPLTSTPTDDH